MLRYGSDSESWEQGAGTSSGFLQLENFGDSPIIRCICVWVYRLAFEGEEGRSHVFRADLL